MSRPLRLEFAGAVYHVISRGDRQQAIFRDDTDRLAWLEMLGSTCTRFNFAIHGFCQMTNHYHLLVELQVEDWPWSSYRLMLQDDPCPPWFQPDWTLSMFGSARQQALDAYVQFIAAGIGAGNPMTGVQHQLFLGDDAFVAARHGPRSELVSTEISRKNRRLLALTLEEYQAKFIDRDLAIAAAYFSTAYTMTEIAAHFQMSYRTVSRIVQKMELMRMDQAVCDWQT